jgi:polysaccharide chain length determinant protein (PEP-CTERM system associated)
MTESASSEQGGFERLRRAWRRRRWLALASFGAAAATAAALVTALPAIYRATTTVLVEPREVSPEALATGEISARLQSISEQILSRAQLEQLIQRFSLYQRYPSAERAERMRNDIKLELREAQRPGGGGVTVAFALSYRGSEPRRAAEVANALAALFVAEDEQIRRQRASGNAEVLRSQVEEARRKLAVEEQRLGGFQETAMGELPMQLEANLSTLERLNGQLRTASDERIRLMGRREDLLRRIAEIEPKSGSDPDAIGTRLARAQQELADLRQRFSDRYPDVIRARAEVAALERAAAAARGAPPAPAESTPRSGSRLRDELRQTENEIRNLKSEESGLRGQIAMYHNRLENAPRQQRAFQSLARDYRGTKDLYDALVKRYEEAQLSGSAEARPWSRFRVLDAAVPPGVPVAPDRLRLMVMALIAALGLALGVVVIAEQRDGGFHSADDLRSFTRVPVLASLPRIVTRSDARRRRRNAVFATACTLLVLAALVGVTQRLARGNEDLVWTLSRGKS